MSKGKSHQAADGAVIKKNHIYVDGMWEVLDIFPWFTLNSFTIFQVPPRRNS
jgi:hypothetical protein